ncbi:MAG: TonB-dependent receptor [Ignavibacteriae bacterium]|nr:TonB-dependent receptor [Ignavibacteriota bacterium]
MNHLERLFNLMIFAFLPVSVTINVHSQTLTGTVSDEQGNPLANVNVMIPALQLQTGTTDCGKYEFSKLSPGIYTIEFYSIGYEKETRTIQLTSSDNTQDVVLRASPLELPAVTVTAKPQPTGINNSAQPVSVLEGRELDSKRGQSVTQSIEALPGVSTFSRGPLSMKPVIRGLTSQRVVVAVNGMRHDSQQWDDEQSPEIDALDVERIEVLRGPNSVLFGSDALGGVVNVITQDPRMSGIGSSPLSGSLLLNGFSNNRQAAGGLTLYGSNSAIEYKGQFSARHTDDIMMPEGALRNSGASEVNGSGLFGTTQEWGTLKLQCSHFGQEIHISPDPEQLEEEPDLAPQQNITHDKVYVSYNVPISISRLEINGTWQGSKRSEFEDEDKAEADSAQVQLHLSTVSVDVKVHHATIGTIFGTVGASIMSQKNETLGLEPLIPGFNQLNFAGYIYEELPLSPVNFSVGLRFDSRRLEVDENDDLGVQKQTRNYTAVTGTAGIVWHATEPISFALNVGRGWRSPIAEELFINGADEGSIRFKIGNVNLEPEESFNLDLLARYASPRFSVEASAFHNRISRYIFLSPTAEVDPASGFTKYIQSQANATLGGGELTLYTAASNHLILHAGFDWVLGKNEETNTWLPMIPANRLKAGLKLTEPSLDFLHNPYIAVNTRVALNQERIDPFESQTGGYSLFDVGFGGEISIGSNMLKVDCAVDNILDKAYFDHLSRYKDYGLNPGRNVSVKISVPFTVIKE